MNYRFVYRRRVEFADTDMAGIMHFSNFFRFMEVTEHAFYRDIGLSVHPFNKEPSKEGNLDVGWPRVHASADFRLPLKFEEEVEIELLIEDIRNKTIHYLFRVWKNPDSEDQKVMAAIGRFTVVCVSFDPQTNGMKSMPIPETILTRIEKAPSNLLE